jgi:hypothetical protein
MGRTGAGLILSALLVQGVASAALAQAAPARPADRDQALPKEPDAAPPTVWGPPDLVAPAAPTAPAVPAPPEGAAKECAKSDFEVVVDDAAAALRDLNLKNKPDFQEKLRQLKDKRGWSHDQFMAEAAPYVRDDKIAVFDQESDQLLNDISSLGQEGADAKTPDCALLHELRARMKVLVDTQSAKWHYMFEKLNAALAQ